MDKRPLEEEIGRARELGQRLEDLVADVGKFTIKNERTDALLLGFWSLVFDYDKGLLALLSAGFYAAAFALWRSIVEAVVRAHLVLMLPNADLDKLLKDDYRVNFKKVPRKIDEAFGLGTLFQNFLPEHVQKALHSFTHSGTMPLRRRFDGTDVAANYRGEEIRALVNTTTSGVFMVTSLVTKHFGLDKEWHEAQKMYGEWDGQKEGAL